MNPDDVRERFLELLEGRGSEKELLKLREAVQGSAELTREFTDFKRLHEELKGLTMPEQDPGSQFADSVMAVLPDREREAPKISGILGDDFLRFALPALMTAFALLLLVVWSPRYQALNRIPVGIQPSSLSPEISTEDLPAKYNDVHTVDNFHSKFIVIEGTYWPLVILSAFSLSIITLCFKRFRLSLFFFLLAVAGFILKAGMSTFINDTYMK